MADLDFPEMTAAECREYAKRLSVEMVKRMLAGGDKREADISIRSMVALYKQARLLEQSQ